MNNVFLTVTIGPDYRLLNKFIQYYKNIGIENFLIILNTPDTLPRSIIQSYGIDVAHSWLDPFSERAKQSHERDTILKYCTMNDWVIYCDLDEFQYYPLGLQKQISHCEENSINFLEGRLIDRVSETGKLIDLNEEMSLNEQFPLEGFITSNLLNAWDKKIVIAKVKLIVGGGHHIFLEDVTHKTLPYIPELGLDSTGIEVHHFKWDAEILKRFDMY
jgi:hypothetical protein